MKNLSLILIILIISIQFIQINFSYAQDVSPTQGTEPSQVIETIQVTEPTQEAASTPASGESAEDIEAKEHKREDGEAKEHMIILVCGILGGCVGTAILIFAAWFIFRKLKGKSQKDDTESVTEKQDDREFDNYIMTIAGTEEYNESQLPNRSKDNLSSNKNIYTQAAAPPQPKENVNLDNIDSRIIRHIKQELLKDLSKQGDYADIPVGIPVYDTSNLSRQKEDIGIQQIKQELLRELDAPRDSIAVSEENMPLGIDKDVVNRLKEEALAEIKSELKERLRKEVLLSNKHQTQDLT